jgi:hypothetical protein
VKKNRTAPLTKQKRRTFTLAMALDDASWDRLVAARCIAKRRYSRWAGYGRRRRIVR